MPGRPQKAQFEDFGALGPNGPSNLPEGLFNHVRDFFTDVRILPANVAECGLRFETQPTTANGRPPVTRPRATFVRPSA